MGTNLLLIENALPELAQHLLAERKRQGLSRAQAAAVCNVSESFIRDLESDPGRCSLGKVVQYIQALGLALKLSDQSASFEGVMRSMTGEAGLS